VEVGKFLDGNDTVHVGVKDNHFIVKKRTETLIIRLLEGEYPEYKDIIKQEPGHTITLDRQMFLMMLKRMSILSSESYKGVIFNLSEGRLLISSTNPDIGESKEDMSIEYSGKQLEMAFNPRFFIETLNVMDDEKIELNIVDEEKPCLIKGSEDKQYISVIMPMRL